MINASENMNEYELLDLSIKGDYKAFQSLVEYFEKPIAMIVKGILGDCTEAEDVGQEVFISFFKSMHQFNKKSSLKTYITRIAINLSLNEIKKRKRKNSLSLDENEYIKNTLSVESEIISLENRELIEMALQKLTSEQRSVAVLRIIEGYSVKETSIILEIPEGTVLSRLYRAQEKLKSILKPSYN